MTTLLYPATGKYLLNPAPGHLHEEVIQWLSDIEFYKTEIGFLAKLLDKAFLRITTEQKLDELKALTGKVKYFRTETVKGMQKQLVKHEHELSQLDLDQFKMKIKTVESDHQTLHAQLLEFISLSQELKKEVFGLVEMQMKLSKSVKKGFEEGSLVL